MLVGVISDTHGSLPEWVPQAFAGVDLIVHAGDVGRPVVLDEIGCIAPVEAVYGNMDSDPEITALPRYRRLALEGVTLLLVHDSADVPELVRVEPADVVVVGHTHRPLVELSGQQLVVNPGSASRPIGEEGPSVALLRIEDGAACAEIRRH